MEQEQKRSYESSDRELIKVAKKPTRGPEETKNDWPTFQKHILEFEVREDEPDLDHPATSIASFVLPNGMGITNTIGRAELAAFTAVILHSHSQIATDSLSSLHQIREHLLYPELHRHHVQGDILKMLLKTVLNSPNLVHLFKV